MQYGQYRYSSNEARPGQPQTQFGRGTETTYTTATTMSSQVTQRPLAASQAGMVCI